MQAILGNDWPDFETALQKPAPTSIRLNPGKPQWRPIEARTVNLGEPIPWHPEGRYLSERPVFTLDPALHAGAYYVQEASSMFVHEAVRQTLGFERPLKILDLCAAPGGKSTLLASLPIPLEGSLVVANEAIRSRLSPLRENMERWGCPHTAVTGGEADDWAALEGWFDLVLTDAPCSGEGLFRKDPEAIKEWSPQHVEFCAARQRRILAAAVKAVAPGGILLYSTCTYNQTENDENAHWLEKSFEGLEQVPLSPTLPGPVSSSAGGIQFFPHLAQGEGFYLAAFRKKDGNAPKRHCPVSFKHLKPLPKAIVPQAAEWLKPVASARFFTSSAGEVWAFPDWMEPDLLMFDPLVKAKWFGIPIGEFKGRDFVPDHALALSQWAADSLPFVDLPLGAARLFLKKEPFDLPESTPKGWVLARHEGLNLGWLKVLPNRANNYLPTERRIRMEI
jgi:16S rRNA C967 or C1407 C5-methylase (RsmB/RsmF family)/NOL1/NOP2/fmu family ribosome biogenesis protein